MTDLRRSSLIAALLISAAVTVAACGGSAATPAAGETTPTPAGPTPAPATTEAPTPTDGPAASVAALPSFDLGGLTNNLSNAQSYRIAISAAGSAVYQAVVVTQPEKAEAITLGDASDSTRIIKIGNESWMATGNDPYQSVPIAMANGLIGAFDPILLLGAFANGNIGAISADLGAEQVNGVNARHYRLDANSTLTGAFVGLPAGAAIDFWVAEDGDYLVSYALTGFGAGPDLKIDVTNVNDPANVVERPR